MKKIKLSLLVFFYLLTNYLNAQKNKYALGLTYQPFYYQSYNKVDWNNMPYSYPDNQDNINGFAVGLVFDKPVTDWFSILSEFTYSVQTQKYKATSFSIDKDQTAPFNIDIKTDFMYFKLPVIANFQYQLGYESTYFLSISTGFQLSYLIDYHSIETVYEVNILKINYDFFTAKYIYNKNFQEYYFWEFYKDPPSYKHVIDEHPISAYKNWQLGILGEMSLRKNISLKYILSLGIRYEYDFTDSENFNPPIFFRKDYENKPQTHNIRKGLNVSLMYIFD